MIQTCVTTLEPAGLLRGRQDTKPFTRRLQGWALGSDGARRVVPRRRARHRVAEERLTRGWVEDSLPARRQRATCPHGEVVRRRGGEVRR